MSWTNGATVTTGDLITAANWNAYNGATGDLTHLHSMAHIATSALAYSAGSKWMFGRNYVSGKILSLVWRNVAIPPTSALGWIGETTPSSITFLSGMRDAINGGAIVNSGIVFATYLISE